MNKHRKPLVAGNWKLFKTVSEALAWSDAVVPHIPASCEVACAPSYTALASLHAHTGAQSALALIAQDVFYEDQGAFTGSVSAPQLKDVGCSYVLVGHSERRQFFGETVASTHKRMKACVKHGLKPVLCIGETLQERTANRTFAVLEEQLLGALNGFSVEELKTLVVAYEPVWAIGTGQVATPQQAQEAHAFIRGLLEGLSPSLALSCRILYGGSVKPDNAKDILAQQDIDGALVGGASLDPSSFLNIVRACV